MSCWAALRLGVANRNAIPCAILPFRDVKTLRLTLNRETFYSDYAGLSASPAAHITILVTEVFTVALSIT